MTEEDFKHEVAPGMTLAELIAIVVGTYAGVSEVVNPPPRKVYVRMPDGTLVYHEWRPEQVPGFNTPGQQQS